MEFEFTAETFCSEELKTNNYFTFEIVKNSNGVYEISWSNIIRSLAEGASHGI